MENKIYKNKNRNGIGSQSETPTISKQGSNLLINGYQKFKVNKNVVTPQRKLEKI